MLGSRRRIRTVLGAGAGAALLLGLSFVGPSGVDAQVTEVRGRAFGIEGNLTITPIDPQEEIENIEIVAEPIVELPADGGELAENETNFALGDPQAPLLEISMLRAAVQGRLGNDGGAVADGLADSFDLFGELILAGHAQGGCVDDQLDRVPISEFDGLFIDGVEQEDSFEPNHEIEIPDMGTLTLNAQEILANDVIAVTAMVITIEDFALPNGDLVDGELRVGHAECGFEVAAEDTIIVDEADPADAFDGDPDFTG